MTKFRKITDDLYIDLDKVVSVKKKVVKSGSGTAPYNFILDVSLLPENGGNKIYHEEYVISTCSYQDYKSPYGSAESHYNILNSAMNRFIF